MKLTNDRTAFYGIVGQTIDIYQAEHAVAAAFVQLGGKPSGGVKHRVVVGRDAHSSGDMMEAAVCAALCAMGADVVTLGVVPSAAVSYTTASEDAMMGIMITGNSHAAGHSGLKFYRSNGKQVTGEQLQGIQAAIDGNSSLSGVQTGKIFAAEPTFADDYINAIWDSVNNIVFENMRIAVDVNGSSIAGFAQKLFSRVEAEVKLLPIYNDDGSKKIPSYVNHSYLIDFVRDNKCDLGFAFSANGESCIVVDETGRCHEIEKIIGICCMALASKQKGTGEANTVLLGDSCHSDLRAYVSELPGVDCRTVSGDFCYLLEELENSTSLIAADKDAGIIYPKCFNVPDGLLTAALLLKCIRRSEMTIGQLSTYVPSFKRAISVIQIPPEVTMPTFSCTDLPEQINSLKSKMSGNARINISRSERNNITITVEGLNKSEVTSVAEQTENLVRSKFVKKQTQTTDSDGNAEQTAVKNNRNKKIL